MLSDLDLDTKFELLQLLCNDHDANIYSPVRHYAKTGLKPASAEGESVDMRGETL